MNKLCYIANIRLPTEKAHGIQIMKMCEAFATQGWEVELVIPKRANSTRESIFSFYNISSRNLTIRRLPIIDTMRFGRIGFIFESLTFYISLLFFFTVIRKERMFVYSRFLFIPFLPSTVEIYSEIHEGKSDLITLTSIKRSSRIITVSHGLRSYYLNKGIDKDKIIVIPNGVDHKELLNNMSREAAREIVKLPSQGKIILYTGQLYEWKGVRTLIEASKFLPSEFMIVIIGGTSEDINKIKNEIGKCESIIFLGQKPHSIISIYIRAADVLVLPNSSKSNVSRNETSPIKMFEYMAGGRPIMAADLPSIREILTEECAIFARPDDARDFAIKISGILTNEKKAENISARAREMVKDFTWNDRAKRIIMLHEAQKANEETN